MQQSALKCCPLPFGAHVNQPAHDQKQLFPHLLYFWGCRQKPDGKVHFSKPTDNLKLYLSLGAISLFLSGTSTRLVKVGKISWFGLQYLIWSSQIWLRWPHLSNFLVATNTTGNCPEFALKISSDFMPTNAETQTRIVVTRSEAPSPVDPPLSPPPRDTKVRQVISVWGEYDLTRLLQMVWTSLWKCLLLTFYPGDWAGI